MTFREDFDKFSDELDEVVLRARVGRLSDSMTLRVAEDAIDTGVGLLESIPFGVRSGDYDAEQARLVMDVGTLTRECGQRLVQLIKSRRHRAAIRRGQQEALAKVAHAAEALTPRTSGEIWAAMSEQEQDAERVQRVTIGENWRLGTELPLTPLMELERAEAESREVARQRAEAAAQARAVAYMAELTKPTGGSGPILSPQEQAIFDRTLGERDAARYGVKLGERW